MKEEDREFYQTLESCGLAHTELCDEDETKPYEQDINNIPENVYMDESGAFEGRYIKYVYKYTPDKMSILLSLKKYKTLRTIKRCIIFFVVIAVIEIIAGFIIGGNISSALNNLSTTTSTSGF